MSVVKLGLFLIVCMNLMLCESQVMRKEASMTVPQLITAAGYPTEKHRVRTTDGYILQMHRIPTGRRSARRSDSSKGKRAVIVIHGLLGCSGDFVIMGPERSLGYLLADAGYDVWLGNLRGNLYTSHQNMTRNNPAFWEYSFHEHGKYDIPAMIDKILNVTGLSKIMYVGYSMGTTSFFTMMAQRPEYNEKIIAMVALAPAVYLDNVRPFTDLFIKTINVPATMRQRGLISVNLQQDFMNTVLGSLCNSRDPRQDLCLQIVYTVVGDDYEQNDPMMSSVIMVRMQPASWRQLEHFAKIAMSSVFTSWENGLYGDVKPYDLTNVKVPVTLLYGLNDQLTEKNQIMRLAAVLNSTGMLEDVRPGCNWPKFNHLDFVFAKDVGKLLNKPLIKHINNLYERYSQS